MISSVVLLRHSQELSLFVDVSAKPSKTIGQKLALPADTVLQHIVVLIHGIEHE